MAHPAHSSPVPPPTGTEARVCDDIARRQQLGIHKYGTTVAGNPLGYRSWMWHAYEEALDHCVYLRRAIEQLDADAAAAAARAAATPITNPNNVLPT